VRFPVRQVANGTLLTLEVALVDGGDDWQEVASQSSGASRTPSLSSARSSQASVQVSCQPKKLIVAASSGCFIVCEDVGGGGGGNTQAGIIAFVAQTGSHQCSASVGNLVESMCPSILPKGMFAESPVPVQAPVEEEVFENERYIPIRGWSSRNLTPLDRRRFSRGRDQAIGDSTTEFPKIPLPNGGFPAAFPWN